MRAAGISRPDPYSNDSPSSDWRTHLVGRFGRGDPARAMPSRFLVDGAECRLVLSFPRCRDPSAGLRHGFDRLAQTCPAMGGVYEHAHLRAAACSSVPRRVDRPPSALSQLIWRRGRIRFKSKRLHPSGSLREWPAQQIYNSDAGRWRGGNGSYGTWQACATGRSYERRPPMVECRHQNGAQRRCARGRCDIDSRPLAVIDPRPAGCRGVPVRTRSFAHPAQRIRSATAAADHRFFPLPCGSSPSSTRSAHAGASCAGHRLSTTR